MAVLVHTPQPFARLSPPQADVGTADGRRPNRWRLRPGWPLAAMFVGFPVWWLIGISNFVGIIAAIFMIFDLVRRRRILAPRGFGLWLLFLAWVVVGVVVLQVDAPGGVPGESSTRYLTWAYRLGWYVAATVSCLYVGNMRAELSTTRLVRTMSWMFLSVAAGGWLGILIPHVDFPSLLEVVLPPHLSSIPFVNFLVHPQIAQLYDGAASSIPRPSAPFGYSNIWGLNFACFLPFFIVAWWERGAGWRRPAAPFVLAVAVVPAIYSLNRGLWAAVIASAIFVAVRSALSGKVKMLAALLAGAVVVGVVLLSSPLSGMIQHRLDNPTSNVGRTNLGIQTVESVTKGSPIVGFGTTRAVQGSFTSIAGGATASCPLCSPPALGTQGELWLVVFSQGLVGLFFYLVFFTMMFFGHLRLKSKYVTMALCVLLVHFVTMPVYDSIGTAMFAIMVAVGLLWREKDVQRDAGTPSSPRAVAEEFPLSGHLGLLRRHAGLIAVFAIVGACVGSAWQNQSGTHAIATVSILLPGDKDYLSSDGTPRTMDTEAQLASGSVVLAAISRAVGQPVAPEDLFVSADPNTRILNLRYVGLGTARALAGVMAAADTLLEVRARDLVARQASAIRSLQARASALNAALGTMDSSETLLLKASNKTRQPVDLQPMREARQRLLGKAVDIGSRINQAQSVALDSGHVVVPADAEVTNDGWWVSLASGLMFGLVAGLLVSVARDAIGLRVHSGRRPGGHRKHTAHAGDLPVIARLTANAENGGRNSAGVLDPTSWDGWEEAELAILLRQPLACVSVTGDPVSCAVASWLERSATRLPLAAGSAERSGAGRCIAPARGGGVVLVSSRHARTRHVLEARDRLWLAGNQVTGVIVTDP